MHEFFKGWRRKAGCIALVMACAVSGVWIRSFVICDRLWLNMPERSKLVYSVGGSIGCQARNYHHEWPIVSWDQLKFAEAGQVLRESDTTEFWRSDGESWMITHWILLLPLTLLSAYLILWNPRKEASRLD